MQQITKECTINCWCM